MNGKLWICPKPEENHIIRWIKQKNHDMHFSHWILHKKQRLVKNPKINLNLRYNYFCYIKMKEELTLQLNIKLCSHDIYYYYCYY